MTARVYPSQQQTNLTAIGSLLVTYEEINQEFNLSQVQCFVNSVERKLIHNNTNKLYSTFITNGDIVRILVTTTSNDNEISVIRRDYTTDDQGGDMGIRDVYITGVTGNSPTTLEVTFTASPVSIDYNFEYLIGSSVNYPVTPTPTPTNTVTPTVTPTNTLTPTPTTPPPFQNVFVAGGGNTIKYSSDGLNWSNSINGGSFSMDFAAAAYCDGNVYMIIGGTYGPAVPYKVIYSYDGNYWYPTNFNIYVDPLVNITSNGNIWLIGGYTPGITPTNVLYYSYNKIDWYPSSLTPTLPTNFTITNVFWNGNQFILTFGFTERFYSSYDGINWTLNITTTTPIGVSTFIFNGTNYIGWRSLDGRLYYSQDLYTFTASTALNFGNSEQSRVLLAGTNIYIGTDINMYRSTNNGVSWTTVPSYNAIQPYAGAIAYNNSIYLANGGRMAYSYNGINWSLGNSSSNFNADIIISYPNSFVTVQAPTPTPTPTNTPTNTITPSITPTISLTPSITPTISLTPTNTPTITPTSVTPTPTPTIPYTGFTEDSKIYVNGSSPSYPGTGTTWTSISTGTTYNGTLTNGPTWNSGTGGYFSFDGVNDFCLFPPASAGSDAVSKTFGGWVRTTTSSTDKAFYFRGEDGSGAGWSLSLYKAATTNKLAAGLVTGTGFFIQGTTTLVSNTWYYVIGRWSASGQVLSLFVNGQLENSIAITGTTLRNSTRGWQIARYNGPTYRNMDIGDFELYERDLSNAEILNNYNARKSIYGY